MKCLHFTLCSVDGQVRFSTACVSWECVEIFSLNTNVKFVSLLTFLNTSHVQKHALVLRLKTRTHSRPSFELESFFNFGDSN